LQASLVIRHASEKSEAVIGGRAARTTAGLYYLMGIGGIAGNLPVLAHLLGTGRLPVIAGIELDGGPFSRRVGRAPMAALILLFISVCGFEVLAARRLWSGKRSGGKLALGLFPIGAIFWWGFELPLWWIAAPQRAILLALAWRSLR
jgi:hypothetical protein